MLATHIICPPLLSSSTKGLGLMIDLATYPRDPEIDLELMHSLRAMERLGE